MELRNAWQMVQDDATSKLQVAIRADKSGVVPPCALRTLSDDHQHRRQQQEDRRPDAHNDVGLCATGGGGVRGHMVSPRGTRADAKERAPAHQLQQATVQKREIVARFTKGFSSTGPSRSSSLWPAPTSGASVANTVAKVFRTVVDGLVVRTGVGVMDGGLPGVVDAEGAMPVGVGSPGMQ